MTDETPFDKKIEKAVDTVAGVVKDVAKDINHMTDNIADAVGHVFGGGKPAEPKKDVDPSDKMGK
jgi:hypothetical protein